MAEDSFSETTDGVKAKLTVEVPEQALTTLSQLAKQTEAYRVSMEAAARATGDHMGYLEKMPTIADVATKKLKEWCDQVEHAVELKGKLGDMNVPGATGQDSANPFGNATLGRGDLTNLLNPMANNDPSRIVSMGAARGLVSPGAVGGMSDEQVDKLARKLASAVGGGEDNDGSGGGKRAARPGEDPKKKPEDDQGLSPEEMEKHALKGRDLIGQMLGEIGPGSSMGDAVGAGRDLLGMASGAGGMLGKIGGFLGPVGAATGLALTANQLVQMGGQRVQDYRNLGGEAGGGFGEGVGFDAQAKMLALDPFISTAQAREVIQGALSAGHGAGAGASFDKVTDFISKNLKDMNMQVGDSVKLLKTNVEDGGTSIDQLSKQLSNLTDMAKNGSQSRSELQADFGANTAALGSLGISGGQQGQIAEQFMNAFQNSPLLATVGSSVVQGALQNPVFINAIAQGSGLSGTPQVVLQKLAKSGQLPEKTWNRLAQEAQTSKQVSSDPDVQADDFFRRVQLMGLPIDRNQARGLMDQLTQPGGAQGATQRGEDALKGGAAPINRTMAGNLADQAGAGFQGAIQGFLKEPGTLFDIGKDALGGNFRWSDLGSALTGGTVRNSIDAGMKAASGGQYSNQILDSAVKEYGVDKLQVTDISGQNAKALDQNDKEQRDKLAAGELLIQRQGGGPPQKLQDFGAAEKTAAAQQVQVGGNLQVSYQGPLSGPSSVNLTANQQRTNTGFPGSTNNHPPPGDK